MTAGTGWCVSKRLTRGAGGGQIQFGAECAQVELGAKPGSNPGHHSRVLGEIPGWHLWATGVPGISDRVRRLATRWYTLWNDVGVRIGRGVGPASATRVSRRIAGELGSRCI